MPVIPSSSRRINVSTVASKLSQNNATPGTATYLPAINGSRVDSPTALDVSPSSEAAVTWGAGIGLTLLILLLATLHYIRKRAMSPKQRHKRKLQRERKRKATEEQDIQAVSRESIPVEKFQEVLKEKKKRNLLEIEFKALMRFQDDYASEAALRPINRAKNASPEVVPRKFSKWLDDFNRVVLEPLSDDPDTEYINATYIDGYNKAKAYIAAQGPTQKTVGDFWRMVWQERSHCIVMTTGLFEHARQQCEKYWDNKQVRYGDIVILQEDCDTLADFNIRTFRLVKLDTEEQRVVKQFQYASWGETDCPDCSAILEFRRRIKSFMQNKRGPIVVHCGSGAGRTGTFLAIDIALDRISIDNTIDIFNSVVYLRNSRPWMVQNLEQYKFIYETVVIYLQCKVTVISATELPAVVQKLAVKDEHTKLNGFEREFKTMQNVVPKLTVGECAGGHRVENRKKSRDIMLQPPERARPYLLSFERTESSDYINAVYVDGYRHQQAFIVTQWPLKCTINDIWRMVYDYQIATIVLLNDIPESRNYPYFWPTKLKETKKYGPVNVQYTYQDTGPHIKTRIFSVKKRAVYTNLDDHLLELASLKVSCCKANLASLDTKVEEQDSRTVSMFQLTCWPSGHKVPTSNSALLDLLNMVEQSQLKNAARRGPICVMSKNGVSRCGVFCAISMACEKLKAEGEVDIFKAVKTVKMNRPQLVENLVEYIYCYTFMVILLENVIESRSVERPLTVLPSQESSERSSTAYASSSGLSSQHHHRKKMGNGTITMTDILESVSVYSFDNVAFEKESYIRTLKRTSQTSIDSSLLQINGGLTQKDPYVNSDWHGMSSSKGMDHYNTYGYMNHAGEITI
ncbi:receptor-type tyrosine-protein phosphatase epsilon isoform X4 [Lingula anatina]|uniref:protein-tyrosine-phosphatase n=1 Tax=Lingula anatina TaxID=7574 RepID=A0A1S3I921_LINAN|nr:receptor-type tyrosine-protein phosphatase epsilon isoform X4 [Lingula anatina]|eukprot:XP_013394760.1 receptor-type tyrosine-protein phosphatase epsilon isoform X4 [Lingula anatina]